MWLWDLPSFSLPRNITNVTVLVNVWHQLSNPGSWLTPWKQRPIIVEGLPWGEFVKERTSLALLCKHRWVKSQVDCSMLISVMLRLTSLPDGLVSWVTIQQVSQLWSWMWFIFVIMNNHFTLKWVRERSVLSITFEYNITMLVSACKCECICSWHDRNPFWSIPLLIHPMA